MAIVCISGTLMCEKTITSQHIARMAGVSEKGWLIVDFRGSVLLLKQILLSPEC